MFSFSFNSLSIDAFGTKKKQNVLTTFIRTKKLFYKSKSLFHTLSAAGQNCDPDVWVALR